MVNTNTNNFSETYFKCGEVFVNKNGKFRWNCAICGECIEETLFMKHILEFHYSTLCEEDNQCLELNKSLIQEDSSLETTSKVEKNFIIHRKARKKSQRSECLKQNKERQNIKAKLESSNTHSNINSRTVSMDKCELNSDFESEKNIQSKHSKIEKHVCEICGKESTTKYNLNSHIKLRHSEIDRKKYLCDFCNKTFVREKSLQSHIKIFHLKDKPFVCDIDKCDRRFIDEKSLRNHKAFHTNERKFICSKCGKKYLHKSKLDAHFKTYHVLGRIHQCKECNKSFYDPYTLRNHMVCHTGNKPFICDECPARFKRENALEWHKKVHSGVKDFICKVCNQAYHLFTGLYAHMKTHGIKYNQKIEKGLVPIETFRITEKSRKI